MVNTFHIYYEARKLSSYANEINKLIPVFASSDIEIYPYQISAAMFALRSPYLKGAILCDEGSLGKSYEAMLVITQMWHERKRKILIIAPTPLLHQWEKIIIDKFTVPLFVIDSTATFEKYSDEETDNPFEQDGFILTTYDYAAEKADYISETQWDIVVFEEAHALRKIHTGDNKNLSAIAKATQNSYKLLLTATPMQNSIMDIYGLINFIDDRVFPDEDEFYRRYFRKPENYPELAERVSKFCFRTTRPQVINYVKIPERIPLTIEYTPTAEEQQLYGAITNYLERDKKAAFPKMEKYELALLLYRTLSSSTFALARTMTGIMSRLEKLAAVDFAIEEELEEIRQIHKLASSITLNTKGDELLKALKSGFVKQRKLGANNKVLIFTENRTTQKYLVDLLETNGYAGNVLSYSGDKTRDYTIMDRFENEAQILVTTDIAAEGFNLEFCSFIINYDLPYNTLTIEQRINRCHRQGQQSDVIVLNFLNRNNFADVRVLELINKRVLQFSGVFGMSDNMLGTFGVDFEEALESARTKQDIEDSYIQTLKDYKEDNTRIINQAEDFLFTSFTKEVADNVKITPQYIKEEANRINNSLWLVVSHFFEDYNTNDNAPIFHIDYEAKTIRLIDDESEPPVLFYYWTGSRNKPYKALKTYGMATDFKPRSGRITLSSAIGRGVLNALECADSGTAVIDGLNENCWIALYSVIIRSEGYEKEHSVLVGKPESGDMLESEECGKILAMPVVSYNETGRKTAHWLKSSTGFANRHELDELIDKEALLKNHSIEMDLADKEESSHLRSEMIEAKTKLNKNLDSLRIQISSAEKELEGDISRLERIALQKKLNTLQKSLKSAEQNLFFDGLRLEQEMEDKIAKLTDISKYKIDVTRQFVIECKTDGGTSNE